MSFAILRNTHEAFRTSIRLQHEALKLGDEASFRAEWQAFKRALAVHVAMEDHTMFALLDEVGAGAITAAQLPDEHVEEERFAARVDAALAAGSPALLYGTWAAWKDVHLRHLAHEEEIVTPLTMKTAPTAQARGRIVHERVLTPTESRPDFDWAIGWVVRHLSDFGSTAQPPVVATRVFARGLQNWSASTILAARRQLSWPVGGGNFLKSVVCRLLVLDLLSIGCLASEARQAVGIGRGAVGKPRTP